MTMSEPATDGTAAHTKGGPPVRIARAVLAAMDQLPTSQAATVARTIHLIAQKRGEPIWLPVPEASEGTKFLALVPDDDPSAPVVIYRRMLSQEPEGPGWRVVALMDRDAYDEYRTAERQGLFNDPAVREAAVAATNVTINNLGTISTVGITPKDARPPR
jgi:hypothetical protein